MGNSVIIAVDGNGILHRSYYGMYNNDLTNSEGVDTGTTYSFLRTILSAIKVFSATHILIGFDTPGRNTFRDQFYPQYKATRKAKKDDLTPHFKLVKEALRTMGFPIYSNSLYEADDIVGTFVTQANNDDMGYSIIVGGDKDYAQLVNENINIYLFNTSKKGFTVIGPREVEEKFGVKPEDFVSYLSLVGDKSDNIPGVAGIGKKGAPLLINTYGNIKEIYDNLDQVKGSKGEKLLIHKQDAVLSYKLATIYKEAPLLGTWDDYCIKNTFNYKGFLKFIQKYEMDSLLDEAEYLKSRLI